ncbi:DUF4270 family protein [Mucilaginibacter terrae]|uniref:DUF4270 family protein n=1 Tax=Mucilaginibacter terrae TaxID=1955052 RepID=UPI003633ECFB
MKFLKLDLLTLLISLFILGSCKNQNDIGLPVGANQLNGTLLVYDDIVVKTDTDNAPLSVGIAKTPLSAFKDPLLGETEASIATMLNLPNGIAYTVPSGTITTDSVVMELRYAAGFYGDSLNSRYKVNVYQLNAKLNNNQAYYSNNQSKLKQPATPLNDASKNAVFNARPNTVIKTLSFVTGGKDTLRTVAPHVRVALNKTFVPNLLFSTPAAITSNSAFQTAINGFYLALQRNQTAETGGTLMFNLDSSRVNVYYRADNGGVIDTGVVTLTFGTHIGEVKQRYINQSNTIYPTAVKDAINPATGSNNLVYLQGLAGLRAKVSFPNLKTLFGTADLNTIAINRAELVVTAQAGTNLPPFVPQQLLTLYRLNIAKQKVRVPDANADISGSGSLTPLDARYFGANVFGGNYLADTREYHFVITGYLQDLLKERLIDYGTYIAPIDVTNRASVGLVDIASTIQTAGRVILVGSDKSSPQRIKLNVIYTKNN